MSQDNSVQSGSRHSARGAPAIPRGAVSRVARRVLVLVISLSALGGLIGGLAAGNRPVGWIVGALLGIYGGIAVGAFAWLLDGPLRGALRLGLLIAAVLATLTFGLNLREAGVGGALQTGLIMGVIGGAVGAILGGFLGWVAGPVFRGLAQKIDEQANRVAGILAKRPISRYLRIPCQVAWRKR